MKTLKIIGVIILIIVIHSQCRSQNDTTYSNSALIDYLSDTNQLPSEDSCSSTSRYFLQMKDSLVLKEEGRFQLYTFFAGTKMIKSKGEVEFIILTDSIYYPDPICPSKDLLNIYQEVAMIYINGYQLFNKDGLPSDFIESDKIILLPHK